MGKSHYYCFLNICFLFWLMHLDLAAAARNTSTTVRCKTHEREALLKIKHIFFTEPDDESINNVSDSWIGEECCNWSGVSCDITGNVINFNTRTQSHVRWGERTCSMREICERAVGAERLPPVSDDALSRVLSALVGLEHLRYLNLSGAQLTAKGRINTPLGKLTNLEVLDLSFNEVTRFPPQLGNLTSLKVLNLSITQLTGSVSPQLGKLTNLKILDLSSNHVTGSIAPQLGNLTNLEVLDLSFNELTGFIPPQVDKLTNLEVLDLSFNELTGFIPPQVGKLTNLEVLDLSFNELTGFIPPQVGKLTNLEVLDLSSNELTGSVPFSLGQLRKLKHLDFSSNSIQGTVSVQHIDNLTKLSYLDMSNNNLSLELPPDWLPPFQLQYLFLRSCQIKNPPVWLHTQASIIELDLSNTGSLGKLDYFLSKFSNLYGLNLSNNFFTGSLPQQFATHQLKYLDIHNNNLSGNFPDWFNHLKIVDYIDLSSNQFTGSLPASFGQNHELAFLFLNNNSLEGVIPPSLGNCSYLSVLDLSENNLSGGIPKSLCDLESFWILNLENNNLSGRVPDCWGKSSTLEVVNLSSNKLSGFIPCSFANVSVLKHLHLNDNEIDGSTPSCLSHSSLQILDVGENKLSGVLTTLLNGHQESSVFPSLEVLRLRGNILNGTIPHQLCNLSNLRVLDLSNNQLIGNIPPCLGGLTGINQLPSTSTYTEDNSEIAEEILQRLNSTKYGGTKTIDVARENGVNETIAGIARQYGTNLKYLATIDLSSNCLVGSIPEELTKLSGLIALNLHHNQLTGKIPEKIGEMKALETLDLSHNKLCGRIPISLGNIDTLNHLNFSFNNFSGPIPSGNHLETLEAPSVFTGNPYLCGDILPKKCSNENVEPIPNTSGDEDEDDADDKRENLWFCLVVMAGVATGFWGVITTLLLKKRWRHALFRRVEDVSDWLYVAIALKVSKLKNLVTSDDRSG